MELTVTTLAEQPALIKQIRELDNKAWPAYMYHGEVWKCCWDRFFTDFPEFQIAVIDSSGRAVGGGHTVPMTWDGTVQGLPASWDATFQLGTDNKDRGVAADTLAGLSVIVDPAAQGQGISVLVLQTMKDVAKRAGFASVIVPVRPVLKHRYPLIPMERFASWRREDGKPFDPWLRTHEKIGGEMIAIANESKVVEGTADEWEEWVSMKLPETGQYIVPGALDVLHIDRDRNFGRHAEPNVWVLHRVAAGG